MSSSNAPVILSVLFLVTNVAVADDVPEDFDTQMMRATVKIAHDQSTATGFILSAADDKSILVTAAHVFEKSPDEETTVVFRSRKSEGVYQKEPTKLTIRKDGMPLWTKHPAEDIAVIRIVPPGTVDLPRIPVDTLASDESLKKYKVHPGETLSCLGYPHRNEANDAGFAILRSGSVSSFPLVPTAKSKSFYLCANSFEGDSGGPVYLTRPGRIPVEPADLNLIMGLVTGNLFLDEEAKMVYGTTKLRHRLGLAIIVHASFIKETIDKLP